MRWWVLTSLLALLWAGCSDDNGGASDTGGGTDASSDLGDGGGGDTAPDLTADAGDIEPPEIRDLRVTIEGELGSEVDLTRGDEVRVLPEPAPAAFRIFTSDDESAVADLIVRVTNSGETELGEQTAELRNGLWTVNVTIEGGMALQVEVEDEAGNVTASEYSLLLPDQREALVDDWEKRFFTDEQAVTHRYEASFNDDGRWSQVQLDTGLEHGGDWWIDDDGLLHVAETTRVDPDGLDSDDDSATTEWEVVSEAYVDDRYLAAGPFNANGDGDDIIDTWSRTLKRYEPDGEGDLQLVEERTETLVLRDDDTWTETWTGTDYSGMTDVEINQSWAGTYRIELNENYTENIGDFLVRTVGEVDGSPVDDEPDRWDLGIVRVRRLLVSPYLRVVE